MNLFSKIKKIFKLAIRAPGGKDAESKVKSKVQNIQQTNKTPIIMSMFNYGVGGNEVKVDANEAIQEIQENKTLIVSKLTEDEPVSPEIITGLKTTEAVFKYFKPAIAVDQETADGRTVKEEFKFKKFTSTAGAVQ